jgi:hypothetical protein
MASDISTSTVVSYSDGTTSTVSYTWKVTGLKTKVENGNTGTVVQTYWTLTGKDSAGNEGTFSGATPFTTVGSNSEFVPFSELTEEQVLTWIQDIVKDNYADHIESQIFRQLDEKVVALTEAEMPWAPALPEVPGYVGSGYLGSA